VKIQAAVAWEAGATLSIEEFDLDDPRDDEILVKVEAAGVCHTDDNTRLGRLPVVFRFPTRDQLATRAERRRSVL
jgi:S-(hydroxymethyl)glutathione dehydrogenase/alcohol dehydrogenase